MVEQEKRLSYQYSFGHLAVNIMLAIVFSSVSSIRLTAAVSENDFVVVFQIGVALFFVILAICQLLYLCKAYVREDRIILKKLFRVEQCCDSKQIVKIKKYNLGRVHYTFVTMQNVNSKKELYMIMNIYAWYAQSKYDAQEVLEQLQHKV
ncbi:MULTISPECIES: hypothetical protein [Myroides]|uniref:Uncharacterized protein n=1 Tax=Myroides albus TaxID=2562892 RepID=A0A6I3LPX8_9FLAO|nr:MULTISPECIES: hypothetical protein [Myroides]MTG98162.1 hypothetical protein [Myroides albus]MVX35336.1 hypothetical protein [Myroides sp. LoEW2-1]UVD78650.1 hypothetical protein NWE55_11015 [Myroides albus]